MTVYVLNQGFSSEYLVTVAIFSTLEKAQAAMDKLAKQFPDLTAEIEVFHVDDF